MPIKNNGSSGKSRPDRRLTSSYPEIQKFSDLEVSDFEFGNEIFSCLTRKLSNHEWAYLNT